MILLRKQLLAPVPGSDWAGEMVLNPAIIEYGGAIHMLFRATGPYPQKQLPGKPAPYPIFLGYGVSTDGGVTFDFDLSRPALAPKLQYRPEDIKIQNDRGQWVTNYANGCIEDPRFFTLDGETYITCACRMFPPGSYWNTSDAGQCAPGWHNTAQNPYGRAAAENVTVNVLFRMDMEKLSIRDYDHAFSYVTHLNNPDFGEDRDLFFFPKRIGGKLTLLSRPHQPWNYAGVTAKKPSILISYGDTFEDFHTGNLTYTVLAEPTFDWESEKIGASTPPIELGDGEWLLNYHGVKDAQTGYTQSFMILSEQDGKITVKHRCPERLIYAAEDFEQPRTFPIPCVFATGLIAYGGRLIMSYGAADQNVGILHVDTENLLQTVRQYDAFGKKQ